jgi:hypothetical protein
VGGTTSVQLRQNVDTLGDLVTQPAAGEAARLREGPRNAAVATTFTIWGVCIEAAVAIAFLAPLRARHEWLRPATLLAFGCTTYAIVPVGGFGALLMLLGAAQTSRERWRTIYLVACLVLFVWAGVWRCIFG